jgi:hypothetical protein
MSKYTDLAKVAATAFIKNDTPLTDSIVKLANDNDLNQEEVSRVAELTNKATHQYLFLKSADKNFTFEVADVAKIMAKLAEEDKPTIFSTFAPKATPSIDKIAGLFADPEVIDLSSLERKHERIKLGEKLAGAIREVNGRLLITQLEKDAETNVLKDTIKHMRNNGINPETIRQTLVTADPTQADEINKLMDYSENPVAPGGMKSGTPATMDPETVVNSDHPVVISVKNIFAKNDSIHTLENARTYLTNQKEKLESVI